jgi:cyclopropane-fatty-acyl-phospholipid synthase
MFALVRNRIDGLAASAGIRINGPAPWDITVHDERLYWRVLTHGSLGLGEAYMDGWWDAPQLDEFFARVLAAELDIKAKGNISTLVSQARARLVNPQRPSRAFVVGEAHYDIGNELYQTMLDRRMTYSCAYWLHADTLDDAQEAKFDLVCRKVGLRPGQRVLDIGCGWGSFLKYAAERHGIHGVGVTVSREQAALARTLCEGLPIEIRLQDYRDVRERFDHVVSIGMFEHVGDKNYRTYFEVVRECLADDGLFLLHTIGNKFSVSTTNAWMAKYIFPNSMRPSAAQIGRAIEGVFVMEDWHNFGADYDRTLMAWHANFERNWPALAARYGPRFYRMWTYYLLSAAGSFRVRRNQLWQIVLSKNGVPGGYCSVR